MMSSKFFNWGDFVIFSCFVIIVKYWFILLARTNSSEIRLLSSISINLLVFKPLQTSQLSRLHRMPHGISTFSWSRGRFFISHSFTNCKRTFSKTHSFLKKQTQAAHSNTAEESISSMINKNKTSSRSSLL